MHSKGKNTNPIFEYYHSFLQPSSNKCKHVCRAVLIHRSIQTWLYQKIMVVYNSQGMSQPATHRSIETRWTSQPSSRFQWGRDVHNDHALEGDFSIMAEK